MGQWPLLLLANYRPKTRTRARALSLTHSQIHTSNIPPPSLFLTQTALCYHHGNSRLRDFCCTDCSIVIFISLSPLNLSLYYSFPLPPCCCFTHALFHCQCVLLAIHPSHTHTDLHTEERAQIFRLSLTLPLLPPQALLTWIVVWRANSSCPVWLCHCGSWGCVCSFWLMLPPQAKVSVTALTYWGTMARCWSWNSSQQDESEKLKGKQ